MKKTLSLLLALVLCLGVFVSCNDEQPSESSSSEEELVPVFFSYAEINYKFELTEDEARGIIEIMDATEFHVEDLCDCYVPYKFYIGEKRIRYHENILEDLSNWRVKKLSSEEKEFIDAIIYKYLGMDCYEPEEPVHN
jgi:hypothetical protein